MLNTTTPTIQGKTISRYYGVVTGEAIMGANVFKDVFASIRDVVGGRSAAYENELQKARAIAFEEMNLVPVTFDYPEDWSFDIGPKPQHLNIVLYGDRHVSDWQIRIDPLNPGFHRLRSFCNASTSWRLPAELAHRN